MKHTLIAAALTLAEVTADAQVSPSLVAALDDPCSNLIAAESESNPTHQHINLAFISGATQMGVLADTAPKEKLTHDPKNGEAYVAVLTYCYAHPTAPIGLGVSAFLKSIEVPKQ
jgi:hypothetical protein